MIKLIALAVLLLSAIILSSCGELPTASGPISLDKNEIRDIARAVKRNNKDIGNYVIECYGKYDGVFICRIIEEGVEPDGIRSVIVEITPIMLASALGALGLGTQFSTLRAYGIRPLLLAALATMFISMTSLLALPLLG